MRQLGRAVLAWVTGAVFVYAAVEKILNPADFSTAIGNYRLLPWWLLSPAALFLPWAELATGLSLAFSGWRRAGALLVTALSCLFMAAVLSAMLRGLDISCGCFGPASHEAGLPTLVLDAGLLAAGWLLAGLPLPRFRMSRQSPAGRRHSGPHRDQHP